MGEPLGIARYLLVDAEIMSVSCCLQSLGRGGEGGASPELKEDEAPLTVLDNNNTIAKQPPNLQMSNGAVRRELMHAAKLMLRLKRFCGGQIWRNGWSDRGILISGLTQRARLMHTTISST